MNSFLKLHDAPVTYVRLTWLTTDAILNSDFFIYVPVTRASRRIAKETSAPGAVTPV